MKNLLIQKVWQKVKMSKMDHDIVWNDFPVAIKLRPQKLTCVFLMCYIKVCYKAIKPKIA